MAARGGEVPLRPAKQAGQGSRLRPKDLREGSLPAGPRQGVLAAGLGAGAQSLARQGTPRIIWLFSGTKLCDGTSGR